MREDPTRFFRLSAGLLLLSFSPQLGQATVLIADFDDLTAGVVNGKGGGTGFSGTWSGSASANLVAGNLTSALYNVPQSGTPLLLRNANNNQARQNFRTVTASPTGEVWFSFLAQTRDDGTNTEVAGISLNTPSTASPFNNLGDFYVSLNGTDLAYSFGAGTAGSVPDVTTSGTTTLIVGRLIINGSGANDTVSVWVNPALTTDSNIFSFTPAYSSSAFNALDAINLIGAISYRNDAAGAYTGGALDNIRFSDGAGNAAQAYLDVTGVPEPSALALLGLAAAATMARRRR